MAGSRNQPHGRAAWLLLVILLVLIGLAARANAAPAADAIAEAVRYANILTGVDVDDELASRAPDDPADQLWSSSEDDDDDDDDDDGDGRGGDESGGLHRDDRDANVNGNAKANAKANADANASGNASSNRKANGNANAKANADAKANAHAKAKADAKANTDAKANAETKLNGDAKASDAIDLERSGNEPREDAARARLAIEEHGELDVDEATAFDPGDAALAEHAGEPALLDDALVSSASSTSDDVGFASPSAGAAEAYEARMRSRSSILGRLDVGLAWRRHWSAPMHTAPHRDDEVWLLATWRR